MGNDEVMTAVRHRIDAAKARNEPLDHILLYGPHGIGKSTLAHTVAQEMGVNIRVTAASAIERGGDLAAILTNLRERDILLIDDIHRLNRAAEEVLLPAMDDFVLHIVVGNGLAARTMDLSLPKFTIIGETTRIAMITSELKTAFPVQCRLDFYDLSSLIRIVTRAAAAMNIPIKPEDMLDIARRARGIPEEAIRLLRRFQNGL